jgi:FxsC-like protein
MNNYWFFLSYSSGNNDDLLRRFSTELIEELRKIIPQCDEDDPVGFRDKKEIDAGMNWKTSLRSALQASRVLVCLYSERYFASEYCGKEFQVFSERLNSFAGGGDPPGLIIPVLWDNPKRTKGRLPQVVKSIQYKHEDFDPLYAENGLYYLMKVKDPENDVAYNKALLHLRDLIYQLGQTAAEMKPLEPAPEIEKVQSAFHVSQPPPAVAPSALTQLPAAAPVPVAKGHDVAWFVYVAGREGDYQNFRTARHYYGANGGYDWKPYLPAEQDRIAKIAAWVAVKNGFQPETLLMSKNLVNDLRNAEVNNTPVVVVLDPWVLNLASYVETLSEFDGQRLATSMVVVVWNDEDQETSDKRNDLDELIYKTFPHVWQSKDVFRSSIASGKDLKKELRTVLKTISNRIQRAPNPKLPVAAPGGYFPKLNVPAETASTAIESADNENDG